MEQQATIDTANYTLMMRITRHELMYAYYHPAIDDSLVSECIALNSSVPFLQAVEQAVYSREVLLQTFKRAYILLPSSHFMLVPNEVATLSDNTIFYTGVYDTPEEEILECCLPNNGALMLSGYDKRVVAFLRRTIDRPTFLHPLAALSEYFYRKSRIGNQCKMYLHLNKETMDVVCFNHDGLLIANTFGYNHVNDAAYHVLNIWKQLQLDQRNDEIHIAGDIAIRRDLSSLLRQYVRTVVPVIFPSNSLALGSKAMQLPYDLIALSLCEL